MNSLLRILDIVSTVALVAVGLIGCGTTSSGGTSSSSGGAQQTALVTGSWSGTLTNNGTSQQLFANVQSQGAGSYFSTMQQTTLCDVNLAACMALMPQNMSTIDCEEVPGYTLTETVIGNQVSGSLYVNGFCSISSAPTLAVSFTGTLSTNGKSVTGTYEEFYNPVNSGNPSGDSGTFNASVSGSVTGNYSGQISSENNSSVNFPITFVLTQNADGSVTGNGTVNNWSCVSTVTFANSNSTPSFAFGGAFQASAQLSQTESFQLDGIPNSDGTYSLFMSLPLVDAGSNSCSQGVGEGSATKQ
jgi:hypothetical protein